MNRIDRNAGPDTAERAVFWQHPRFPEMGLLKARFRRHRYALHTHPSYVIALITGGCESVRVLRRQETAPASSVIIVNPEECHDGQAGCDDGWAYRTFYPTTELMAEVAGEIGRPLPLFPRSVLHDPEVSAALLRAHRSAEQGDGLDAETAMLVALRGLIVRHGDAVRRLPAESRVGSLRRVAVYRAMLETDPAGRLELSHFAAAANVTRFQVIRDFKYVTGFTPSGFIRDRRVRLAARLIRCGETLARAAASAGFADQSHLTRAFKLSHGFTPGVLCKAQQPGQAATLRHE